MACKMSTEESSEGGFAIEALRKQCRFPFSFSLDEGRKVCKVVIGSFFFYEYIYPIS